MSSKLAGVRQKAGEDLHQSACGFAIGTGGVDRGGELVHRAPPTIDMLVRVAEDRAVGLFAQQRAQHSSVGEGARFHQVHRHGGGFQHRLLP